MWSPEPGINERGTIWLAGVSLVAVNSGDLDHIGDVVKGPDNTIALYYLVEIRLKL